jgi:signal transduction histidine kinase
LTKARSIAKNQFTKIKYDSKKATQEVIKYKNQKSLLLALLGLIVVIAILLYKLYQIKNKRKLQQATYVTETRISKRIHDELANDVFNAMTFTQTQNLENPITKEALLDNLEHIYQRTRDISKENSDIRTDENYEPDLFQMIDGYGDSNLNVILKINEPIHWQKITPEKKITLQRVIQEFLINTKKHSEATVVIIDFSEDKKNITVNYTDNGIGIKNTQQRKSGLQNAENRILAIQGSFTFDQTIQKGFKVTVVIPK